VTALPAVPKPFADTSPTGPWALAVFSCQRTALAFAWAKLSAIIACQASTPQQIPIAQKYYKHIIIDVNLKRQRIVGVILEEALTGGKRCLSEKAADSN